MVRRGFLDADFFALLLSTRPKLSTQINEIRQTFLPMGGSHSIVGWRSATVPEQIPILERPPTGRSLGVVQTALAGVAPMQFIGLTAGDFTMGSNDVDDEKPRRRISLSAFQIATMPVTVRQWRAMMGAVPNGNNNGDDCPVVCMSWLDAIEFLGRLSDAMNLPRCYSRDGDKVRRNWAVDGYRLPTEAEWEFAARGGTTTHFSFGDSANALDRYAWHAGNANGRTHVVGTREANPFGLRDVHGNVWEWVEDWYGPYGEGDVDPRGPGTGKYRVLRGGSFACMSVNLRSALRHWLGPSKGDNGVGLRVARGGAPPALGSLT